jgi:hypothetical protein
MKKARRAMKKYFYIKYELLHIEFIVTIPQSLLSVLLQRKVEKICLLAAPCISVFCWFYSRTAERILITFFY